MSQSYFKRAFARRRIAGNPVGIIFESFVDDLRARGHTPNTIRNYVGAVEHFGTWLKPQGISLKDIRQRHVRLFLGEHLSRCHCPKPSSCALTICRPALARLVDWLETRGVVALSCHPRGPVTAVDRLLLEFDQYLDQILGLVPSTRQAKQRVARDFLGWRFGKTRLGLQRLNSKDPLGFITRRAPALGPSGIRALTAGLRSFLRFLHFSEHIPNDLCRAVPRLPLAPTDQPPQLLSQDQLHQLLRSFDKKSTGGRRDFAMAMCLSGLGLRAAEVAGLIIDDLDWTAMTLRLRQTKQRRERLLPLPPEVGQAVANYLEHGRPKCKARALFVRHRAPVGEPLQPHHVRSAMRLAFARCGINCSGTHILRHSWATLAHRRGASLKLIADMLGHRSLNTTNRYAHVNIEELRQVALPWPCR